jgi:cytochrome b561
MSPRGFGGPERQRTSPATPPTLPGSDRDGGYGWISIALHWLTAAAILVLLFAGDSIATAGEPARRLHTTLASSAWAILLARVVWRLWQGHPRSPAVGPLSFYAGAIVHYLLLAGILAMLVSGPMAGWASGGFDIPGLSVPGANPAMPSVHAIARTIHVAGATTLAIGTAAHVAGVLKHMFVDRDHTLDRIMVPPRRPPANS